MINQPIGTKTTAQKEEADEEVDPEQGEWGQNKPPSILKPEDLNLGPGQATARLRDIGFVSNLAGQKQNNDVSEGWTEFLEHCVLSDSDGAASDDDSSEKKIKKLIQKGFKSFSAPKLNPHGLGGIRSSHTTSFPK